MALESIERETCIGWSDDTHTAEITTFNRAMINKLAKLARQYPSKYKLKQEIEVDGEKCGVIYTFPKNLVTLRAPTSRVMTEEQRKVAGERLKKSRAKKTTKHNKKKG